MKISFHGAARNVTGSKHILHLNNGTNILFDCGMFQGLGAKTTELNADFGFDAKEISFLLLSHAHIDHTGLIPKLVKEGFTGKIYCTEATKELTEILLLDSASIQQHEADIANKNRPALITEIYEPLYTTKDVEAAMALFKVILYDTPFSPEENITAIYINAGHLIGSAAIHVSVNENGSEKSILFSGDIGRTRSALLKAPAAFPHADYIILESTYGNSVHDPVFNSVDPLIKAIKKTCIEKKGKLIIPAFSVGRTQEVLYALNQLELEKRLPELNYYVDSPLSKKATEVIKHHMDQFNDRLQEILKSDADPFDFAGLKYIDTVDESKALTESIEPCVILSAGGTADAGRVKNHIYANISDPKNTVLFVGYCQEQSLGGKLLRDARTVEVFGEEKEVHAEIDALHSMSAHGDHMDLTAFLSCADAGKVKTVFLVHGEYETQLAFVPRLEIKGFEKVVIPAMHEEITL